MEREVAEVVEVAEEEDGAATKKNISIKRKVIDPIREPRSLHLTKFTMRSIPDYDTEGGLSLVIKIFTAASQRS